MKKVFRTFVAIALVGTIAGVNSCTKTCDLGYEGDDCKTEVRTKYLGAFNGTESCTTGNSTIAVNITSVASDVTKVNFNNLYGAAFNNTGTVQADGDITIANQTFGTGQISGSATVDAGKVKVTYTVTAGGASDACTWTQN
ncbi:MAG: hypothetical protein IPH78_03265 [Bacteroidetes bacterium]|nr:hypothetical protein [Bacteroidota bacterium]MBK8657631.1 hypothetical protein [Bacteroidota bacterium]